MVEAKAMQELVLDYAVTVIVFFAAIYMLFLFAKFRCVFFLAKKISYESVQWGNS